MAKRKRGRVPGTNRVPSRRKGGWRHINDLLHEHGIELAEGERVVATLAVPADALGRKAGERE